jgi:hypothetical protein
MRTCYPTTGFGGPYWNSTSWTANGTPIVPQDRPDVVFDQLFRVNDPSARLARRQHLNRNASILDHVKDQARQLKQKLGKDDRTPVDQYFSSIRDVEEQIKMDREWVDREPPRVDPIDFGKILPRTQAELNDDGSGMKRYLRLYFDVIALAFQTDSTRVVAHLPQGRIGPDLQEPDQLPLRLSHSVPPQRRRREAEILVGGRPNLPRTLGLLPRQAEEHQGRPEHLAQPHGRPPGAPPMANRATR